MRRPAGAVSSTALPGGPGAPPLRHYDRGARSLLKCAAPMPRAKRGPGLTGIRPALAGPRQNAAAERREASAQRQCARRALCADIRQVRLAALRLPSHVEGTNGQNPGAERAAGPTSHESRIVSLEPPDFRREASKMGQNSGISAVAFAKRFWQCPRTFGGLPEAFRAAGSVSKHSRIGATSGLNSIIGDYQ